MPDGDGTKLALVGAGAVGGTLLLSKMAKADEERKTLEGRVNQIEALLKEAGIGPAVGWADEVDKKLSELKTQLEGIQAEIQRLKSNDIILQDGINSVNSKLESLITSFNQLVITASNLSNKVNELQTQLNSLSSGFKDVHDEIGGEFNAIGNEIIHSEFDDDSARSIGRHFINIGRKLKG